MNRSILLVLCVVALGVALATWMWMGGRDARDAAGPALAAQRSEVATPADSLSPSDSEVSASSNTIERQAVEARPIGDDTLAPKAVARRTGLVVRGEVRDERGDPVRGAVVLGASIENRMFVGAPLDATERFGGFGQRRSRAVTDAQGRFELEDARPGDFRIAVRAAKHVPHDDDTLVIPAGESHDIGRIVLGDSAVVAGRVIDQRGRPVADARIGRVHETSRGVGQMLVFDGFAAPTIPLVVTGDDGGFTLDQLPGERVTLVVTSDAHPDHKETLELPAPGTRMVGRTIVLDDGFEISGRVRGIPGGQHDQLGVIASVQRAKDSPAPEFAFAFAESRRARLSPDGTFTVRGLREAQRYDVSLRRARADEPTEFQSRMSSRVTATAGDRGVELVYQPESSVVMTVIDAQTRKPVEEFDLRGGIEFPVPVFVEGRPQRNFPEGKARVENLRPGRNGSTATIEIQATGYEPFRMEGIALVEGGEVDLGVVELQPAPVCRVTVLDAATGTPVGGARVTLTKMREEERIQGVAVRAARIAMRSTEAEEDDIEDMMDDDDRRVGRTDVNGVVELSSFPGARCELTVTHKAHARFRSGPFVCASGMREEREVRLSEGGTVRVTLVTEDGVPIAGGKVEQREAPAMDGAESAGTQRAVTDAAGLAEFHHLPAGAHQFRREVSGGNGFFGGGNFAMSIAGMPDEGGADWVDAAVIERGTTDVRVVAPTLRVLSGKVTEAGAALAGAQVSLSPRRQGGPQGPGGMRGMMFGGQEATTDAAGRYQIPEVKAGDYTLTISHVARQMPAEFDVVISSSDKSFDVDLDVAIIEGTVVGPDGKPMAGARVSAERDSGPAPQRRAVRMMVATDDGDGGGLNLTAGDGGAAAVRTDGEGRYTLRGVLTGVPLIVKAEAKGYQSARSDALELAPDQVKRGVDLALSRAGKIEVSAFKDGAPANMVVLNAYPEGTSVAHPDSKFSFLQNGKNTIDGLKPGKWTVQARFAAIGGPGAAGAPAPIEQTVEVRADDTSPMRFDL